MPAESFQHYSAKQRIIAWVSKHLFDNFTYTVRHGLLQGMKRKGGLGWIPYATGGGETPEYEFWRKCDLRGATVYDVGAFHGLLTLYFAKQAQRVVCYEPNETNRKRLNENLALNRVQNVTVRPVGLGTGKRTEQMIFDPLMPGGATLDGRLADQYKHRGAAVVSRDVQITSLDADREENDLPAPTFVKFDIEGLELEALKGARETIARYKPALFIELHGDTMQQKRDNVARIVSYLEDVGYRNILHIESATAIDRQNSDVAAEGHLYCLAE